MKGGGEKLAAEYGVPFLGAIPLDPRLGLCAEQGQSILAAHTDSPVVKAFDRVVQQLLDDKK